MLILLSSSPLACCSYFLRAHFPDCRQYVSISLPFGHFFLYHSVSLINPAVQTYRIDLSLLQLACFVFVSLFLLSLCSIVWQLIAFKLSNLSGVKTQINKAIEKVLRFGPQLALFIMLIASQPRGFTGVIYCSPKGMGESDKVVR